jgi:hypothetical protein
MVASFKPSVERVSLSPSGRILVRQPIEGSGSVAGDLKTGNTVSFTHECGPIHWADDTLVCLGSGDPAAGTASSLVVLESGGQPQVVAFR